MMNHTLYVLLFCYGISQIIRNRHSYLSIHNLKWTNQATPALVITENKCRDLTYTDTNLAHGNQQEYKAYNTSEAEKNRTKECKPNKKLSNHLTIGVTEKNVG